MYGPRVAQAAAPAPASGRLMLELMTTADTTEPVPFATAGDVGNVGDAAGDGLEGPHPDRTTAATINNVAKSRVVRPPFRWAVDGNGQILSEMF